VSPPVEETNIHRSVSVGRFIRNGGNDSTALMRL